jgi:beta-glucosidase
MSIINEVQETSDPPITHTSYATYTRTRRTDPTLAVEPIAAAFPPRFLWGAATAAYQIEGAISEDGRSPSIWDTFSATPEKVCNGDTGEIAADHYHRMPQDVAMMAQLGLTAYRFSIAWSRILPTGRGSINAKGLDFYERLVDTLLAHGIQPFATLYHWDLPQALQDEGGWLQRETAYAFADYAEIVTERLGDRVGHWVTHNEPWCAAFLGHATGTHAPGVQDRQAAIQVGHHLLLSHGLAVPRIRKHCQIEKAQVGIALNFTPVYATDDQPETRAGVALADAFSNRWFIDPLCGRGYPSLLFDGSGLQPPIMRDDDMATISTPIDFLGVNNYSRMLVRGKDAAHARDTAIQHDTLFTSVPYEPVDTISGATYTTMGWEVYPHALRDILLRLHRDYALPALYVTENGASFHDSWDGTDVVTDQERVLYLHDYIMGLTDLFPQGVPLKGYFAWSLIDNFEWSEGYSKRFGLVYLDYPTQRRVLKESAHWYADLIAAYVQQP